MSVSKLHLTAIVLLLPSFLIASDVTKTDKGDARAREIAERFTKAILDRNLDETMKVVDVPWCSDAKEIITDKKKVAEQFRESFQEQRFNVSRIHVREVATLRTLKGKAPPKRNKQASLGVVLSANHRVVYLELEHDGRFQPVWIGVNLDKEEAKVVGVVD